MVEQVASELMVVKKLVWNRRYKAWRLWFGCLVLVSLVSILKGGLEIFKFYAMWSTTGLIALIGGLSVTDFIKLKNGLDK